jgi:hypothetical protein
MLETLGRKQLEKKRIGAHTAAAHATPRPHADTSLSPHHTEDGERAAAAVPQWRSEVELQEARAFKEAAAALRASAPEPRRTHDPRLARFYSWAQTSDCVFIAVHVPTGYADKTLRWEASPQGLRVQAEDSPAVIDRDWACDIDADAAADAFRSADNRMLALTLRKGTPGRAWPCLFAGDSVGVRCVKPPYSLAEAHADVLLEWPLPRWVAPADVAVDITHAGIHASVRGVGELRRTFWECPDARSRRARDAPPGVAVEPSQCAWALREEEAGSTEGDADGSMHAHGAHGAHKVLSLLLVKPPLTLDEIRYRSGVRADNRAADHPGAPGRKGFRFFEDDADAFGLEDVLQALCFVAEGRAWVQPPPNEAYHPPHAAPHWARSEAQLSKGARAQLKLMRQAAVRAHALPACVCVFDLCVHVAAALRAHTLMRLAWRAGGGVKDIARVARPCAARAAVLVVSAFARAPSTHHHCTKLRRCFLHGGSACLAPPRARAVRMRRSCAARGAASCHTRARVVHHRCLLAHSSFASAHDVLRATRAPAAATVAASAHTQSALHAAPRSRASGRGATRL